MSGLSEVDEWVASLVLILNASKKAKIKQDVRFMSMQLDNMSRIIKDIKKYPLQIDNQDLDFLVVMAQEMNLHAAKIHKESSDIQIAIQDLINKKPHCCPTV